MPAKKSGTPPTPPPVEDLTKTGGNGDDDQHLQVVAPGTDDVSSSKTRKAFVTAPEFEFIPASLVGSWFHRLENDHMIWQGVVVAEPQPGVYLVLIDKLDHGATNVQRLVPLTAMVNDDEGYDWRFYDTENEARSAFAQWVATEKERS